MKIFFDTNVYIAEALLGATAERLIQATLKGSWRVFTSPQVLDEVQRVMETRLRCSRRFAVLTRKRVMRRASLVFPRPSRVSVPGDPDDSPILQAAVLAGADYLVTNDRHLIELSPYGGLRIVSMADYHQLLVERGLL